MGLGVWGLGFKVYGSRVLGLGFRRVWGYDYGAISPDLEAQKGPVFRLQRVFLKIGLVEFVGKL